MSTKPSQLFEHVDIRFPVPPAAVLDAREAEAAAEQRAQQLSDARASREKNLDESRPPVDERDVERLIADDLEATDSLMAVQNFADSGRKVLLLTGDIGVGKTVASAWLLARRGGEYLRAERACGLFMARYGEPFEEQKRLKRTRELVVIDELGTERDPAQMMSVLLEVIDERRWKYQQTILVGNLNFEDFSARYSDKRFWSRVRQCGSYTTATGEDLRRRK